MALHFNVNPNVILGKVSQQQLKSQCGFLNNCCRKKSAEERRTIKITSNSSSVILFTSLFLFVIFSNFESISATTSSSSSSSSSSRDSEVDVSNLVIAEAGSTNGNIVTTETSVTSSTSSSTSHRSSAGTGRALSSATYKSPWTWRCVDGFSCQRELANNTGEAKVPLNVCWLTCGVYGPLWPFPTIKTNLSPYIVAFYPQNAEVVSIQAPHKAVKAMLGYSGNILLDRLFRMHPKSEGASAFPSNSHGRGIEDNVLTISLRTTSTDTRITLNTDESYTLLITTTVSAEGFGRQINVEITGTTYFGVRHGLETLGQLIAFDDENECLQIVSEATIQDRPAFRYRGLMIDTSRNFIPIFYLKKMVDAMSYNKMNILHWSQKFENNIRYFSYKYGIWDNTPFTAQKTISVFNHITDTNSFPFYSKRVPQMTKYGAYSAAQIYSPKDVKDLVLYARLRGVKILPELDAPAHAGNGWQWGSLEGLGDLALCVNQEPWRSYCGQPPCGQLNPLNNYTYLVLGEIYKDMLEAFDKDLFHMGGDEVFFQCWYYQQEIRDWQRNRSSIDLMDLWGYFQEKAFSKLIESNNGNYITPMVWTSDMTTRGRHFLNPADYIIQIWTGSTHSDIKDLLQGNYRVVFSNVDATYLDHGYGTWLGRDHFWTIKTWQNLYDNDLVKIAEHHLGVNGSIQALTSGLILGGEATLWSEKVDQYNMEMKLWPRSAAFAERLWSNPRNRTHSVYPRLLHHRARMMRRGIHADRLQPESCEQISGYCNDPYSRI